jgi:hypothetical protein
MPAGRRREGIVSPMDMCTAHKAGRAAVRGQWRAVKALSMRRRWRHQWPVIGGRLSVPRYIDMPKDSFLHRDPRVIVAVSEPSAYATGTASCVSFWV